MKLNLQERLTLVNVLPEKGNFETHTRLEALRTVLYPTEEESKEFGIRQTGNNISFNSKGFEQVDVPLTEGQIELLQTQLENLSKENALSYAQYELLKRFRQPVAEIQDAEEVNEEKQ